MPYFDSKNRTVFSPQSVVLEPLYKLLEKYQSTLSGSKIFDDMVETYEYLDFVLKDVKSNE